MNCHTKKIVLDLREEGNIKQQKEEENSTTIGVSHQFLGDQWKQNKDKPLRFKEIVQNFSHSPQFTILIFPIFVKSAINTLNKKGLSSRLQGISQISRRET